MDKIQVWQCTEGCCKKRPFKNRGWWLKTPGRKPVPYTSFEQAFEFVAWEKWRMMFNLPD